MKTILCYGDSNTHGFVPAVGTRFPRDVRWTGRMAAALGADYTVIEEGLNGRTTALDDPLDFEETKNGRRLLPAILHTHAPLDLILIMLGTNDLKSRFQVNAYEIAKAHARLGELAQRLTAQDNPDGKPAQILLVSPILVGPGMADTSAFRFEFGQRAVDLSHELAGYVAEFAAENGFHFFDASKVAAPCQADSLHLDANGHAALAEALTQKVRQILA